MSKAVKERLQRIQRNIGAEADGLLGVETLTKLELALGIVEELDVEDNVIGISLVVSQKTLEKIIYWEVGGRAYYDKKFKRPCWPGGQSGVTFGFGYDVGYYSKTTIANDWKGLLTDKEIEALQDAAGIKGSAAKAKATSLSWN